MTEWIESYEELRNLPERTVVQDANGQVWCVEHHERWQETWLSPFSDEYSCSIKPDGTASALGRLPKLPITDLGVITSVGG